MRPAEAARYADDRAPRALVPVRRAESRKGRDDVGPRRVRHFLGILLRLRRFRYHIQLVAQPLHRRPADEDAALESVFHMVPAACGDGRDKPVFALDYLTAGVHQQEAARAVGVLHLPRFEAALPKQCALLVARKP